LIKLTTYITNIITNIITNMANITNITNMANTQEKNMSKLAEIRKRLLEQESKNKGGSSGGYSDNTIYPFWNIAEGTTATLRFLPDGDDDNIYFWRERQMIKIPFSGVKGGDETRKVMVTVPCVEMWNEKCPIHDEIRPWFKDPSMEDMARTYWKKRSYLFQGFAVDSGLQEENVPENPIRRFIMGPEIFNIIKAALMDPDFDEIPTDYEGGTDFRVTKTQKGQYASYATSNWARRSRSLTQEERDAIAEFGLFNLNDFLPKKPGSEELEAIFAMFEDSVDGQLYDPDKFANFYKPAGLNLDSNPTGDSGTSKSEPAKEPVKESLKDEAEDEPEVNSSDEGKSAQDILAAIRNRKPA